jgi:molybdopterin molybdotransferase
VGEVFVMLDINEALSLILDSAPRKAPVVLPVPAAMGLVLAEDVASDMDSPPYDKSLMDGYAVIAADLAGGEAVLQVVEEVAAGSVPRKTVGPGTAVRIMTGAPIPQGADAVVIVERSEMLNGPGSSRVRLREHSAAPGMNILPQGRAMRRGEVVLHAGTVLRPIETGLLAEVGRTEVRVLPKPQVAVLSTGDELLPADQAPQMGQIRNSNGPMLAALVQQAGGISVELGIARDREDELREKVLQGLEADVLLLSGGVSMGIADLVPKVLQSAGVEQVFHHVRLKPGKPLWFGAAGKEHPKLVFGLPGNPVSSLVCFELFVRPALAQLAGRVAPRLPLKWARLNQEHRQRGDRPVFHPAILRQEGAEEVVELLDWKGSADLRTLADADCLVHFPAGEKKYAPGERVGVYLL